MAASHIRLAYDEKSLELKLKENLSARALERVLVSPSARSVMIDKPKLYKTFLAKLASVYSEQKDHIELYNVSRRLFLNLED